MSVRVRCVCEGGRKGWKGIWCVLEVRHKTGSWYASVERRGIKEGPTKSAHLVSIINLVMIKMNVYVRQIRSLCGKEENIVKM